MKKIYLFTFISLISLFEAKAQMGINKDGSTPHPSAILDVKASSSTNAKGLLMPRVADHTVITSPATGLIIFNTTTNTFWYFNGTAWADMGSGGNAWSINGTTVFTNNNVGINTATPQTTFDVKGDGFLVSQKTKLTTEDPNLHQYNMLLNTAFYTDLAGILYDPSGPSAPYPSGSINTTTFIISSGIGIKFTFETFETELNGDSLILLDNANNVIAKYSGNILPANYFYNGTYIGIKFKTNGNSTVGQGFKIKWQTILQDGTPIPLNNLVGNIAYFESSKGAFRTGAMGLNSAQDAGNYSIAMGYANKSTGVASSALGYQTKSTNNYSSAIGYNSSSTGLASSSIGYNTAASGNYSIAMGNNTVASGENSVSLGINSNATGNYSTAIGSFTNATSYFSTAFGSGTLSSDYYATSMGYYTIASSSASFASGFRSIAGGNSSTAMGNNTNASGYVSTALGYYTIASGQYSTSIGYYTNSSNTASFASGYQTTSSGYASTATGYNSTASGNNSTAMGSNTNANFEGAFVIGDSPNSSATVYSQTSNSFTTRFRNGYYLYTTPNLTTGVYISGGGNSWSTISDSTKKENFQPIDGENVLKKIANMRTVTWNYKGQDPKLFRHYGPMAQEFFNAFGRDKLGVIGNDTTIASADFDGVNFTAIKALEKRTSELQTENENLKKRLALLEKSSSEIIVLKAEMEKMKAFLLPEKEKIGIKSVSDK